MPMSPLGNVIHVNQNMQVQTLLQAREQNRVDFQTFMNMDEFNEKLDKITEVRPTEELAQTNKDGKGDNQQEMSEEKRKEEKKEEDGDSKKSSSHLLDMVV